MKEIIIKSFVDYIKNAKCTPSFTYNIVYRGHANIEWSLLPGLFRVSMNHYKTHWTYLEDDLIDRFANQATPYIKIHPKNLLEWIVLAQHHGLPTRLLDWSRNPLVALYFAVINNIDSDGIVFELDINMSHSNIEKYTDDFLKENEDVFLVNPKHVTPRISAQQGCFTLHPTIRDKKISLEEHIGSGRSSITLRKFIIPAKFKSQLREDLNLVGINAFSLFPDLDGLSSHIKWQIQTML